MIGQVRDQNWRFAGRKMTIGNNMINTVSVALLSETLVGTETKWKKEIHELSDFFVSWIEK